MDHAGLMLFEPALAGMPSLTLNDLAEMRIQSISFFGVVLLLSTWGVQSLWNGLQRDFPRLPRLTYKRALMLVGLWGFVFILVLTMISGARELMTPRAWEKDGLTYKLADEGDDRRQEIARWSRLAELKSALWTYANQHDGRLPGSRTDPAVPAALWESADITAAPFEYRPDQQVGDDGAIIAWEPALDLGPRFALFGDGSIRELTDDELAELDADEDGGQP
ncbi:MAG: hypothetical protein AAGK78_04450 [Planctomycetota bacterium]